jgi:hypothetical protein
MSVEIPHTTPWGNPNASQALLRNTYDHHYHTTCSGNRTLTPGMLPWLPRLRRPHHPPGMSVGTPQTLSRRNHAAHPAQLHSATRRSYYTTCSGSRALRPHLRIAQSHPPLEDQTERPLGSPVGIHMAALLGSPAAGPARHFF